jgi:hypothetical protein
MMACSAERVRTLAHMVSMLCEIPLAPSFFTDMKKPGTGNPFRALCRNLLPA